MPREDAIKVEGTVVDLLPNGLVQVALPNGHQVWAHVSAKMRLNITRIEMGDKVTLEMSPFDMSKGCIVLREKL